MVCDFCGRDVPKITMHHFIPKTRHKNKKNKKIFSREEVKQRTIPLCPSCHGNIHAIFSEKDLEMVYNTREALVSHPDILKFTNWVRNKPSDREFSTKKKDN